MIDARGTGQTVKTFLEPIRSRRYSSICLYRVIQTSQGFISSFGENGPVGMISKALNLVEIILPLQRFSSPTPVI